MYRALAIYVIFSLLSCNADNASNATGDNVARVYWPNGKLKTEIPALEGKRHGLAKSYFQNGVLRQEIEYVNGIKNGISRAYYESGKLLRESTYRDDELDGIRKQFWSNGQLRSAVTYTLGEPCGDLKEFYSDGTEKTEFPEIVITGKDEIFTRGMYTLQIRPSEKVRSIKFYRGVLGDDGCIDRSKLIEQTPQEGQQLNIYFPLPKGTFRMEEIFIVAQITTDMGNPYLVEKVFPLAIEN